MMYIGAIILALLILGSVITLLLKRQLREKYAILWLLIGVIVLVLGLFPQLLTWITLSLGFRLPSNLIFTLSIALLLAVTLHLSWELSRNEEETRRLAEEVAIGRTDREQLRDEVDRLRALVERTSEKGDD